MACPLFDDISSNKIVSTYVGILARNSDKGSWLIAVFATESCSCKLLEIVTKSARCTKQVL